MKEKWEDIKGYEKLYQVSNLGNVKSVDRVIRYSSGQNRIFKGQMIKQQKSKNGYLYVDLFNNGKKHHFVHRVVAEVFIDNANNLPQVNHKDENKLNNCVDNLEWCTVINNLRYGTRSARAAKHKNYSIISKKVAQKLGKHVAQVSCSGEIIKTFPSIRQASRETGYERKSISLCCNGTYQRAYGFIWKFIV